MSRGRSARASRPPRPASAADARVRPSPKRPVSSTQVARTPPRPAPGSATARTRTPAARSLPARPPPRSARDGHPTPLCTCARTPASVASSGSTACVAEEVHCAYGASAPSRSPPQRVEAFERTFVVAPRAFDLARELLVPAGAQSLWRPPRACSGAPPRRTSRSAPQSPGLRAGRRAPASATASAARPRRVGPAAAGSSRPSPPTATPRRTATCRSPRRRACACAARSRARRASPAALTETRRRLAV